MRTVYLDYNATTPLDRGVFEAMQPFFGSLWGNPSSIHHVGRQARVALDDARDRGAKLLQCKPSELVFTSGGTESINLAILGSARKLREKGRHLITSTIEHHAVLQCFDYLEKHEGFEVTHLPVDQQGFISPQSLKDALRPETVLVSIMAANNEIGTVQPVSSLGLICRESGVLFHTDAVQWFAKEPFSSIHQFNADLVSICSHKFHGPKGVGALFIRSPFQPHSILFGGGHENERRAGTENLAGIVGLVEAVSRFVIKPVFHCENIRSLGLGFLRSINDIEGIHFLGSMDQRLWNTVSFVVDGADSISLLAGLDLEGICASSGSACSAGSLEPSHVVRALGYPPSLASSLVRFSLGRETTVEDLNFVIQILPHIVARAKRKNSSPDQNNR